MAGIAEKRDRAKLSLFDAISDLVALQSELDRSQDGSGMQAANRLVLADVQRAYAVLVMYVEKGDIFHSI